MMYSIKGALEMEQFKNHFRICFKNKTFVKFFIVFFVISTPIMIKNLYLHFEDGTLDFWNITSWIMAYVWAIWVLPMFGAGMNADSKE